MVRSTMAWTPAAEPTTALPPGHREQPRTDLCDRPLHPISECWTGAPCLGRMTRGQQVANHPPAVLFMNQSHCAHADHLSPKGAPRAHCRRDDHLARPEPAAEVVDTGDDAIRHRARTPPGRAIDQAPRRPNSSSPSRSGLVRSHPAPRPRLTRTRSRPRHDPALHRSSSAATNTRPRPLVGRDLRHRDGRDRHSPDDVGMTQDSDVTLVRGPPVERIHRAAAATERQLGSGRTVRAGRSPRYPL